MPVCGGKTAGEMQGRETKKTRIKRVPKLRVTATRDLLLPVHGPKPQNPLNLIPAMRS